MTFQQTTFAAPLRRALESAGYTSPTPTQCQSWPMVSTGRDLISIAKTGSGKTGEAASELLRYCRSG